MYNTHIIIVIIKSEGEWHLYARNDAILSFKAVVIDEHATNKAALNSGSAVNCCINFDKEVPTTLHKYCCVGSYDL